MKRTAERMFCAVPTRCAWSGPGHCQQQIDPQPACYGSVHRCLSAQRVGKGCLHVQIVASWWQRPTDVQEPATSLIFDDARRVRRLFSSTCSHHASACRGRHGIACATRSWCGPPEGGALLPQGFADQLARHSGTVVPDGVASRIEAAQLGVAACMVGTAVKTSCPARRFDAQAVATEVESATATTRYLRDFARRKRLGHFASGCRGATANTNGMSPRFAFT